MAIGLSTGESFEDMFEATYMPPQSNMSISTRSDTERALIDDEQYASLHQDTATTPLTPMPSRALKADIEARRDVSEQDTGQLGGGNFVPGRYFAGDLPSSYETDVRPSFSLPRTDWTTDEDVEMSKRYELSYGDPAARYIQPGLSTMDTIPVDKVPPWYNALLAKARRPLTSKDEDKDITPPFTRSDIDQGASDYIHRAWLGSRRSAVSQLGFDMGHTVLSPTDTKWSLSLQGMYQPDKDRVWANSKYESAVIHESVHRGLKLLMDQKIIPNISKADNEYLTRLFMHRHFRSYEVEDLGGPEMYKEFLAGSTDIPHNEKYLDRVEKLAADYIAKKRPMGPR